MKLTAMAVAALLTTTAVYAAPREPRPTPPPVSTEPGVAVPPMVTPPVPVTPPAPTPAAAPAAAAPEASEQNKPDWSMQATWCPMIQTMFGGMAYQTNVNLDCTVQPL